MNKIIFSLIFILSFAKLQAQGYLISFGGIGAAFFVDSVQVQNLTQGENITLGGADELFLGLNVGIDQLTPSKKNSLYVYPNPITSQCNIEFELPTSGLATLAVSDVAGRKITSIQSILQAGTHLFNLSGLNSGVYTIILQSGNLLYSSKIISNSSTSGNAKITYVSDNSSPVTTSSLKSGKSLVYMQYNPGDRLLYKGFSGIYSTVITDIPVENKMVTFNFIQATDGDGNNYASVTIGTQIWMVENLKTTKYSDGTSISLVPGAAAWWNATGGAYCWYDNDYISNGSVYGALYNWKAVDSLSNGGKSIAPTGWHVPTLNELTILINYLGGESLAGSSMKETGKTHWNSPNSDATNSSGFSALGAGGRWGEGSIFYDMGDICDFWTVTSASDGPNSWECELSYDGTGCFISVTDKRIGMSIRCLKD
ncbi:MAG: FISUMP domain-containing protein [Lentimicrobium sp.]|jgi:uncharacterized protein (TIGR02145 family)|nr:FISUMP domain-containing protein [Lentimicrobium sp.]